MYQNNPNPFNPETSINFTVPKMSRVTLAIYDILGGKIRTLVSEPKPQAATMLPGMEKMTKVNNWQAVFIFTNCRQVNLAPLKK